MVASSILSSPAKSLGLGLSTCYKYWLIAAVTITYKKGNGVGEGK